jgi:hypothetical protein
MQGRFGWFIVVAYVFVILHIRSNQCFLKPVLRAVLQHKHIIFLEDNFRIYPSQAMRAKTNGEVVIGIRPFRHKQQLIIFLEKRYKVSNKPAPANWQAE